MLIFLTPHVIEDEADLQEVYMIKTAQRQEFIRRFYGKSREQQEMEMKNLLQYSMNQVDQPSVYRESTKRGSNWEVIGSEAPAALPLPEDEDVIEAELSADENPTITPEESTEHAEEAGE